VRVLGQKLGQRLGSRSWSTTACGRSGIYRRRRDREGSTDGYTIGIVTVEHAGSRGRLSSKLPTIRSRISRRSRCWPNSPYVLVLYPACRARHQGVIALAKAKPGSASLRLGRARKPRASRERTVCHALGSSSRMCLTRDGASVIDLIAGRIEMQFATIAPSLPTSALAQLRALAVHRPQALGRAARRPHHG